MTDKLTPKQERFVQEYLLDLNATQAAIRAGYSGKTANEQGSRLLANVSVSEAIRRAMQERSKRTEITQDDVLRRWWELANVDVNEIIQYRRLCCRHCHGVGHAYQWEDGEEFGRAVHIAAQAENALLPTDEGGYGFNPKARSAPLLPEVPRRGARGSVRLGHPEAYRRCPHALRRRQGDRPGLRGQDPGPRQGAENVARHLGMFKDRVEVTGKDGGPIVTQTKEQRDAAVAAALAADS